MNDVDAQYHRLVRRILDEGSPGPDRTGTGTLSVFGHQMRFDLTDGLPLLTTKRTFWKGAVVELLWMLRGGTNVRWLQEHGVHIWDEWADDEGDLGPVYGAQWRAWQGPAGQEVDQIESIFLELRHDPYSRRHVLSAWNPVDLPDPTLLPREQARNGRMALAPCHTLFQFYYRDGRLSGQLYQRSTDVFLGLPFNLVGYATLIHLFARRLGYKPGELVWAGGDCHLYMNHMTQVNELLSRDSLPLPALLLSNSPSTPFEQIEVADIHVVGYAPHPAIPAPVAV